MPDLAAETWAIAIFCAFLIGVTKTGMPGMGILVVPLMASIMPAKTSVGVVLPMLILADLFAVIYYKRHANWRRLVLLLPWVLVGVVVGWRLMGVVDDGQLGKIIGAIVLVILALGVWQSRWSRTNDRPIPHSWWLAAIVGVVAGATSMMANAAGPIMTLYLLAMGLSKHEFIGTGAWYYVIGNCVKVPFYIEKGLISHGSLVLDGFLAPAVVIGAILGVFVLKRVPEKAFRAVVQILAAAAAVKLLIW